MIGWRVAWKCRVACLPGELSQQPTCPHVRHRRRCTQRPPVARHSSQPAGVLGFTERTWATWAQEFAIGETFHLLAAPLATTPASRRGGGCRTVSLDRDSTRVKAPPATPCGCPPAGDAAPGSARAAARIPGRRDPWPVYGSTTAP